LPEDVENATRDDLLELYYQYIIPRPQRKYRLNRRGRDMTKKQILQAKKRKITGPDSSEPASKYVHVALFFLIFDRSYDTLFPLFCFFFFKM
jgi:hypothetical protein